MFEKNKVNVLFSILGLVIGICSCLILINYRAFHKNFDKHFKDSERIYRVITRIQEKNGKVSENAKNYCATVRDLKDYFSQVEDFTYSYSESALLFNDEKKFVNEKTLWVHESFLKFFGIQLLDGVSQDCLKEPKTGVISETAAKKFFGNKNPIGQILKFDAFNTFVVKGVFKDIPSNSHFKANFIITMAPYTDDFGEPLYTYLWYNSYIKLNPKSSINSIENEITSFANKYLPASIKTNQQTSFKFQNLEDIHLKSHVLNEIEINYSENMIRLIFIMAIFILVISCINFVNIYITQSFQQLKEVGVRRVLGAVWFDVVKKNFSTTIIISFVSILLSVLLLLLFKTQIGNYFGDHNFIFDLFNKQTLLLLLIILLGIAIFPCLFVSLLLFSNNILYSLKSKFFKQSRTINIRIVLIVFQFIISICIITITLSVYLQIKFITEKNLGFDPKNILAVNFPRTLFYQTRTLETTYSDFKARVKEIAGVENITWCATTPGQKPNGGEPVAFIKGDSPDNGRVILREVIDDEYINVYKLKLVEGVNISSEEKRTYNDVLLNETAVKELGSNNKDIINQFVGINYVGTYREYKVIGVIHDFHFQGLQTKIRPVVYKPGSPSWASYFCIRLSSKDLNNINDQIKQIYNSIYPNDAYYSFFVDDFFNNQYKEQTLFKKILFFICFIIILVSAIGVFALISENIQRKLKSIAIRKILGATNVDLFVAINKSVFILILIAIIISLPLSYLYIKDWLNNFAYVIKVNILIYILPILLVCMIVLYISLSKMRRVLRIDVVKIIKEE